MAWEPLPTDVAEWMGMDDDYLRCERRPERRSRPPRVRGWRRVVADLLHGSDRRQLGA